MSSVLNKYHHNNRVPPGAVDIMRGTAFGNPFEIGAGATREQVVAQHRVWLWRQIQIDPVFAGLVLSLHGRDLCCCCAPRACHGDTLVRAAEWLASRDAKL